jgi:hypothetical protein
VWFMADFFVKDYVNFWPPSVTLTLDVSDRLLRMTHRLILVNNCGKYLQNPFKVKKVMDRTRHIPSNRQCWPWMSKCYLDFGVRSLVVAHDIFSYYNKHLWQVISDSYDKWQSYGPDTKVGRTDGLTKGRSLSLYPLFSKKRRGTISSFVKKLKLEPADEKKNMSVL